MNNYSEIKQRIKNIAGVFALMNEQVPIFLAKITAVDGATCEIELDGTTLTDVRLRSVINNEDSKLVITPKVGSYVILADLSGGRYTELVAIQYSEIDKIEINTNEIIINGGNLGGMVKSEIVANKVSELEKKVNEIITILTGVTIPLAPTGTYPFAPIFSAVSQLLPLSQKSDFENEKIKH
ncbi:MAG: hypothetical protein LBN95_06980 [Prevotellaceae bacterium]|jgi:hypothetical protein|nr:hypothetical protein [Prevotellaceae bacterium]